MQKTTTAAAAQTQTQPVVAKPRSIFNLGSAQLKMVVGGGGVVNDSPHKP